MLFIPTMYLMIGAASTHSHNRKGPFAVAMVSILNTAPAVKYGAVMANTISIADHSLRPPGRMVMCGGLDSAATRVRAETSGPNTSVNLP